MLCTQDKSESLAHPPPWLKSALSDVARLVALPANWDSYGSPPLSETARQNAVQLLASIEYEGFPAPCIVPLSGGGLQIEWQDNRRDLELEVVAGSHEVLFLKVHEDDSAEEGVFSITDRSTLRALLDWLLGVIERPCGAMACYSITGSLPHTVAQLFCWRGWSDERQSSSGGT